MSFRDSQIIRPVWPFTLNHNSPQAQGLVGWWPMQGLVGGNTIFDLSGNGLHATLQGTTKPDWRISQSGDSAYYNGSTSGAEAAGALIGDSDFFNLTDFTIIAWIQTANAGSGRRRLLNQQQGGSPPYWILGVYGNQMEIGSSHDGVLSKAGPTLNDDYPHCLTFVRKAGSTLYWYVDGREVNTAASGSSSGYVISASAYLGKYMTDAVNESFVGLMWDCRIYNRALSPAEVFALYDPQTRYDLYWELGRRAWFLPPATQAITPNAISQAVAVPNPTITPGAVTIAPSLLTQSVSVPHPTVAPGAVTVAPDVISQGVAMQQPTIAPGAVTVAPSLLTQAISIPNPTVGQAGGGAALALSDAAVTLVTVSDTLLTV